MEEPFTITVSYKGKEHDYTAQLHVRGYSYHIRVLVDGMDVDYERDDEGAFRAMLPFEAAGKEAGKYDVELLKAIAHKIEALLA